MCQFTLQRGVKVAEGIKSANQRILGWGDYPGLLGWVLGSHKDPYRWSVMAEESERNLKGEEGTTSQGMKKPIEAR